jgi:hypothetical protein
MSQLDKRLPKNATKFGDHLSIISVGNDVQGFSILSFSAQINISKLDKRLPKNATDKV